jgi:uncharacterized protein YyaL (SSP411 family)
VWTREQVRDLLDKPQYTLFARRFGLDGDANFEGRWHLYVRESLEALAASTGVDEQQLRARIDRARQILLEARNQRVAPGRDEKQLTSWNALAIRGLAIAGRALQRPELVAAAAGAIDFIRSDVFVDGRLLASYKDGQARFAAYLDDHACLLDALIELLQARWDGGHLEFAVQLAELLLARFQDAENGGFYFTADDQEVVLHRARPFADDATPSGNGVAAFALQRLGFLLGETRYLDAAENTLRAAWSAIDEYPHAHVSMLTALEEYLTQPEIIIIRGHSANITRWQTAASRVYAPRRLVFAIDADEKKLPGALEERRAKPDATIAYRCVGSHCSLPLNSWEALAAEMSDLALDAD